MTRVTHPAWKTKPSWFIIGIEDRMVPVALARTEVKMIGASKLELHSSHVPMISQPEKVAAYMVVVARNLK
jgi:pimeloyl-ACP methyl ester carboxylesterase